MLEKTTDASAPYRMEVRACPICESKGVRTILSRSNTSRYCRRHDTQEQIKAYKMSCLPDPPTTRQDPGVVYASVCAHLDIAPDPTCRHVGNNMHNPLLRARWITAYLFSYDLRLEVRQIGKFFGMAHLPGVEKMIQTAVRFSEESWFKDVTASARARYR